MAARADTSCSTVLLRAAVVVTSCSTAHPRAATVATVADTSCSTVAPRAAMVAQVAPVDLLYQWQNLRKKKRKKPLRRLLN
jgi:hypothetical protein